MNDNGYWRQRKKPNPEEDVLITFIHNEKSYVCIGQFFPKGYEVDWLPIERECDFVKQADDTWIFTKDMWMESYFHCDDIKGVWIEDEVVAWKPLPKPFMKNAPKLKNIGDWQYEKWIGETE